MFRLGSECALIFLKYIESFGIFSLMKQHQNDRSKSGIRCFNEQNLNEGRQKFEKEKNEARRPMEVRAIESRKQKEVYSA